MVEPDDLPTSFLADTVEDRPAIGRDELIAQLEALPSVGLAEPIGDDHPAVTC